MFRYLQTIFLIVILSGSAIAVDLPSNKLAPSHIVYCVVDGNDNPIFKIEAWGFDLEDPLDWWVLEWVSKPPAGCRRKHESTVLGWDGKTLEITIIDEQDTI